MTQKANNMISYFKDSKNWNIPDYLFLLLCFILFFYNKLAPVFLVLFIVSSLFYKDRLQFSWKKIISLKNPLLWMSIFFILHIVGLFWTENTSFAQMDIGMKASFILFPLLTIFIKTKVKFERFIDVFVFGLVLTVLFLIGNAIFKSIYYEEDNHWAYFFESEFSAFMHRSYFATYAALGAIFSMIRGLAATTKKSRYFFYAFVLSVGTFFTISKAGIIILALSLVILTIHHLAKNGKVKLMVFTAVLISIFLFISLQFDNRITSRFKMMLTANKEVKLYGNPTSESNEARLIMWNTSWNIIKENPILGVGTGDVKDVLIQRNTEYGNTDVATKKLNSHNQFLNSWVQIGILGFLAIVLMFSTLFYQAYKRKNTYLFYFGLVIFISLLVESFFETQAGIIPFCFMTYALLTLDEKKQKLDS